MQQSPRCCLISTTFHDQQQPSVSAHKFFARCDPTDFSSLIRKCVAAVAARTKSDLANSMTPRAKRTPHPSHTPTVGLSARCHVLQMLPGGHAQPRRAVNPDQYRSLRAGGLATSVGTLKFGDVQLDRCERRLRCALRGTRGPPLSAMKTWPLISNSTVITVPEAGRPLSTASEHVRP